MERYRLWKESLENPKILNALIGGPGLNAVKKVINEDPYLEHQHKIELIKLLHELEVTPGDGKPKPSKPPKVGKPTL